MILKPFRLLAALLVLALVAGAIARWAPRFSAPGPTLPNPNGWADFVRAGQLVTPFPGGTAATNRQALRAYLATNAEPLQLVQQGLSRECRISWGTGTNGIQQHMDELAAFKHLARLLESEALLAELDGRLAEGARIHLQTIRLGHEAVRGGVVIDKLVGVAIESIGTQSLEQLAPRLDAPARREIAEGLSQVNARRESVEVVLLQEAAWRRANLNWYQRLIFALPLPALNPARRIEKNLTTKISQQSARVERLCRSLKD